MEKITSRKNNYISHLRSLGTSGEYRYSCGEFLCDSVKLLKEAISCGAEILSVLWKNEAGEHPEGLAADVKEYFAPADLFDYASPMKNSPGPLFVCQMPESGLSACASEDMQIKNAVVLENVQDPGNVGTVIRTANAFGISAVILTGACADLYSPKTSRATMGAIFRQKVIKTDIDELKAFLKSHSLPLYGALLSPESVSIRDVDLTNAAVAIGSEGKGLSKEFVELCSGKIIIPMQPGSESLNAAMAGTVLMWEMSKGENLFGK